MALTRRLPSGSAVMSNGLILSPRVMAAQVTSFELFFEPSAAIIAKKLNTLGHDFKDFRTPLRRAIQQVVIPSIQMNFHKHGRPRWAPLAESTVRKKSGNMVPLDDTGALREGMKSIDLWTIRRQDAFIADLPQTIWYGKVHQAGQGATHAVSVALAGTSRLHDSGVSEGEGGAIPARPFVMLQPTDEILIEQVFDIWLGERITAAGF